MLDELELLKKDWQKREANLPKLSYEQIYPMIKKKSSSIVKWIFYISIIEFVFWAGINIVFSGPETMEELKAMHIHKVIMVLNVVNYGIILYFILKFYNNYKKISITDSSRNLMKTILKVKRTVTQYVWFNLIIFTTYLIINMYGVLIYGPEGKKNYRGCLTGWEHYGILGHGNRYFRGFYRHNPIFDLAVLQTALWNFIKKASQKLQRPQTFGSLAFQFALVTVTSFLIFLFVGQKLFLWNYFKE
jgi:hypothetical protein